MTRQFQIRDYREAGRNASSCFAASAVNTNVLPEKLLIVLAKVFDSPPAIELLQDSNATDYGESFLAGRPPSLPFVHDCEIGMEFLRQKNRTHLTGSQADLGSRLH